MADFVSLANTARRSPTKENLDALWAAMFQLSHWTFIPVPGMSGMFSPYVGVVGNQQWVMTFTDAQQAANYAVAARIAMPGAAPLLQLAPRAAAVHVPGMRAMNVLGVLVNPGPEAFYTPFEQLRLMVDRFLVKPQMPPPVISAPAAHAETQPITFPQRPPVPTSRVSREQLLAFVEAAATDPESLPHAIAALRFEPEWYVIGTKNRPGLPALEIGHDGKMAAQVYTDQRTADTMQQLMAMVPGDTSPIIPMAPEAAIARFSREDMVEQVVFNPRGENLVVAVSRLL
jgi:hypothetical protein